MSSLSLKISGKRFEFFNKFNVSLIYNSIASVFSFDGLIINDEQKQLFKPLSYHDVEVLFDDEILITGTVLNTSTSIENLQSLGNIAGYSKPGILEDCDIPLSLYPLQSDGLNLKQITEKLIKPFGLKLIVDNSVLSKVSKTYDITSAESNQKIKEYLTELARQRNIILTHDNKGNLVYTKLNIKTPSIATYTEGMPSTKMSLSVNGQAFHSDISVIKQATIEVDSTGEKTVKNSLISKFRPTVKKQSSGDNNDTESGAEMIRASELRNIVLTIETDRWYWSDGNKYTVIKPNYIIDVISPSNFINNKTRFFVERVDFKGDNEQTTAVLTCVLPECYNGNAPKNIFE